MQRREWLKAMMASSLLPVSFGANWEALAQLGAQAGRRLILVELAGANDGLNTLVPVRNDHYHALRPSLGLSHDQVISLDEEYSVHASLKPLMDLWERGELAWVQGLGYPAANRSHFKSIALWETGSDGLGKGADVARNGWLTHDIEHRLGRKIADAHGISLVSDMGLFDSDGGRWLSMNSTSQLLQTRDRQMAASGADTSAPDAVLSQVAQRMQELTVTVDSLSAKLSAAPAGKRLPGGEFGEQLQQVVRLIRAGVDTPVFRVRLQGFDTHENQLGRHKQRLRVLGTTLRAVRNTLVADGEWNNTLVMSYSEFGRRAAENKSGGTDHGTAAPHFVAGGAVQGGLYGNLPDLSSLIDGDPEYTMDYRQLYESMLNDWFGIADNRFSSYRGSELRGLVSSA